MDHTVAFKFQISFGTYFDVFLPAQFRIDMISEVPVQISKRNG